MGGHVAEASRGAREEEPRMTQPEALEIWLVRLAFRDCSDLRPTVKGIRLIDICHNWVEQVDVADRACWLHRKGAAPSTAGPVIIPGSRGAFTYLVAPKDAGEKSAFSLAHGAGRKWSRSDSRARLGKPARCQAPVPAHRHQSRAARRRLPRSWFPRRRFRERCR